MPEYLYENPDTGEQVSVWQSAHEEHSYKIERGGLRSSLHCPHKPP